MAIAVDFVIPVLNEEKALADTTKVLHQYLLNNLGEFKWRIVIVDNGSTDSTFSVAKNLSQKYNDVACVHLEKRGRGRALRQVWLDSNADVMAYMDVDLSTELSAIPYMLEAIEENGYDLAVGCRLKKGASVAGRPLRREITSRAYNFLIKGMFLTPIKDHQCGFKAISRKAALELLPLIRDTGWFFDSELLIIAWENGYRIREVPVTWKDDPDTRVRILSTAWVDFKGLMRLRFGGLSKASKLLADNVDKNELITRS